MKRIIGCFVLLFCLTAVVKAETVILNDGTTYVGNIHHQDDKVVFIVQEEKLIKLNMSDVKEIKQDEEDKKKIGFLTISDDMPAVEDTDEFIIKLGYDFYGEFSHKGHVTETESSKGVNLSAEYYYYFHNIVGVGCGATVQSSRDIGDIPGKFYFLPVYLSLKIRSTPTEPYKYGYAVGRIGYNMFFPDSEYTEVMDNVRGGLYYSLGIGIVYNNVVFEIASSVDKGNSRVKSTKYEFDVQYTRHTFSIGYIF